MTIGIRTILRVLLVFLGLLGPSQAVAQSADQLELWVTNQKGEGDSPPNAVLVHDVGQAGGKPTLTLTRILAGPATMLNLPTGILVTADKVYVANEPVVTGTAPCVLTEGSTTSCGFITIFDRPQVANSCTPTGPPAPAGPTKVLAGRNTRLNYPFGIAINNRNGELYVANQTRTFGFGAGSINVYDVNALAAAPGGVNADIAPIRTIVGGLEGPSYIVYDEVNAELFVANSVNGLVTVHRRNNNGDFIPVRSIREKGAPDETRANPLQQVSGLALVGDELFVAHGGVSPARILVYRRTDSGTPDPLRRIDAVDTPTPGVKSLDDTTGLAVDLQRNLLFSGNDARTTSQGFISVFDRTAQGVATPLLRYQESPLFSPVGLALAARSQTPSSVGDYTVRSPADPTVPRPVGAPVDVPVTLGITPIGTARGTVTVEMSDVTVVPPVNTTSPVRLKSTSSATCSGALCSPVSLTFSVSPTTPLGTYAVTVATHGTFSDGTQQCAVDHSTTFNIVVTDVPTGTLTVSAQSRVDPRPGICTVTSDKTDIRGQRISCGSVCSGEFRVDASPVTLTATHESESIFAGWDGCTPLNTNQCSATIARDVLTKVTAFCDRLVHITVVPDGCNVTRDLAPLSGADITCGSDCYVVNNRVPLTLTATAPTGSRFVGWTGCSSTDNATCRIQLTQSTTVTAACAPVPAVNLTVFKAGFQDGNPADGTGTVRDHVGNDGEAITCGSACSKAFAPGTPVTLTATPDPGSVFVGWKAPTCGTSATCTASALTCGTSTSCSVTVTFTGETTMEALFVKTPQETLIARLYLYVFEESPPSGSNLSALVAAVGPPVPTLTGRALLDAFFDGPKFAEQLLTKLTPEKYVAMMFRAFLGQEPRARSADPNYCFQPRPPSADPDCFRERIIEELFRPLVASLGNAAAGPVYQSLLNRPPDPDTGEAAAFSGNVLGETLKILAGQEYERRRRSLAPGLNQDITLLRAGFPPGVTAVVTPEDTDNLTKGRKVIEDAFRCSSVFQTQFGGLFPLTLGCQ